MALGLPSGGIKIGGHTIPWPAIGALAGVAGVVLVLRARAGGSQVVAAGTTPALPDQASVGVLGQGQEAQLANLAQQLFDVQQTLASPPAAAAPAPAPAPTPAPTPVPVAIPIDLGWQQAHGVVGWPISSWTRI